MDDCKLLCIHQLFERQAELHPDQIAIVFNECSLTYAQLNEKSNKLAHYLQDRGVKPDHLVGICVNRSLEMMIALLAILKAGGAYVPFDPGYPKERLSFIAEDTGINLLLTQNDLVDRFPNRNCEFILLDTDLKQLHDYPSNNLISAVTSKNLAYVIYTSGSTGMPKGVMVQHDSVVNQLQWIVEYLKLDQTDVILQQTSISFDVSVLELFEGIISGGKLIIAKPDGHRDNLYVIDLIRSKDITTIHLSPSVLQILMETHGFEQCTSLRQVCSAGEAMAVSIANRFPQRNKASLFNMYGPTEATILATSFHIKDGSKISTSVPIGKPVNNTQIYILNQDNQPVLKGETGEVFIGGIQVARGYLNQPELTKTRFISGLISQNSRLYKTGDLARFLDDDNIEYLGRVDHQIQLRGNRIEPGEIEAKLVQYSDVKQAMVVMRENQFKNQIIVAYLISETTVNQKEIRDFLNLSLPRFMVPTAFVTLKAFPLTINGKVDRQALPIPSYQRFKTDRDFKAPRSELEYKLSELWAKVLHVDDFGIKDNFFEWGGDSLAAIEVSHLMESVVEQKLPIMFIFENPTIESVINNLYSIEKNQSQSSLERIQIIGQKRPLFYIGATKYARSLSDVLGNDQPVYGLNIFGLKESTQPESAVTIESIAQQFLSEIKQIQPSGPYQMASFCGDSVISFEIAQQLSREGESVSLLAMIDTVWNEDPSEIINTQSLVNRYSFFNLSLLKYKLISKVRKVGKSIFDKNIETPIHNDLLAKHNQFILKVNEARLSYAPEKYSGAIVSFLSQEYLLKFGRTGLHKHILNEEIHKEYVIEGFHDSLFDVPYVSNLGELLKLYLHET